MISNGNSALITPLEREGQGEGRLGIRPFRRLLNSPGDHSPALEGAAFEVMAGRTTDFDGPAARRTAFHDAFPGASAPRFPPLFCPTAKALAVEPSGRIMLEGSRRRDRSPSAEAFRKPLLVAVAGATAGFEKLPDCKTA